jgi:hypothetical protein
MMCATHRAAASHRAAVLAGALSVVILGACGGGSSGPTASASPPVVTPTPTPTPPVADSPGACSPTPPPLHGIKVKVHDDSGFRKILDSRPQVVNADGYCAAVGFGAGDRFCFTRFEDDPQAAACDALAVGKAGDTGRWGPTWFYEGQPCAAIGEDTVGCRNHADNQFLVIAKGPGEYAACASPGVAIAGDRCGVIAIK